MTSPLDKREKKKVINSKTGKKKINKRGVFLIASPASGPYVLGDGKGDLVLVAPSMCLAAHLHEQVLEARRLVRKLLLRLHANQSERVKKERILKMLFSLIRESFEVWALRDQRR